MTESEYQFDGWTLRVRSGELLREGQAQRLPQQPLRVLSELLQHPGEVVTRERLVQVLWPKGVVDFDNSLNAVVRKLRVVLGDDSEQPRYIETLPRIGYRFVGKLEASSAQQAAPPPGDPAPHRSRSGAAGIRWALTAIAALLLGLVGWLWWQRTDNVAVDAGTSAPAPQRPTSQRAYELFLKGKSDRSRRDTNDMLLAVASFEAALKEDPHFVEAWAALAETYTGAGINQRLRVAEAAEKARAAALRAIELDPNTSEGHAALAAIKLHLDNDFTGAEAELEKARRADDHNARMWHSWGLLRGFQGRIDEALQFVGRARELEPTAPLYAVNYANLLYQSRRYAESIQLTRELIAAQPRFDQARGILIRALAMSGDVNGALEQLPLRFWTEPVLSDDGLVYALAGRRTEAQQQVERLQRHAQSGFSMSYELAILHAALGETDQACAALRRAPDDHSQQQGWMRLDPRLDPLREQPCYGEVQQKLYGPK